MIKGLAWQVMTAEIKRSYDIVLSLQRSTNQAAERGRTSESAKVIILLGIMARSTDVPVETAHEMAELCAPLVEIVTHDRGRDRASKIESILDKLADRREEQPPDDVSVEEVDVVPVEAGD